MSATVSDVRTKAAEAAAAIESGDYATARTKLMAAQALLVAIPDAEGAGFKHSFQRDTLTPLINECKRLEARGIGSTSGRMQSLSIEVERGAC